MDKFIMKHFVTEFYTIEYEGIVGGETHTLYSSGGSYPTFSNHNGKVWKSLRDIKLHLCMIDSEGLRNRYLEQNPVVCKYSLVGGSVVREVVCVLSDMLTEEE